jgi:hypothetical protein
MRVTIGIKIFGIAVGLLILMAVVALLSMRMTRSVDDQLVIIDDNHFPASVALAQANIHFVEESAYARRLLLATAERPGNAAKLDDLWHPARAGFQGSAATPPAGVWRSAAAGDRSGAAGRQLLKPCATACDRLDQALPSWLWTLCVFALHSLAQRHRSTMSFIQGKVHRRMIRPLR